MPDRMQLYRMRPPLSAAPPIAAARENKCAGWRHTGAATIPEPGRRGPTSCRKRVQFAPTE
eukprot:7231681-Prymnesium_polylepis.1